MILDRSHFLLFTAALAAGGAGGWVARDKNLIGSTPTPATPVAEPAVVAVPSAAVATPPPAPSCDDSVGTVDVCPPVGPAAEGMCVNMAAKRCADFKTAFKPKVAANALACLRALKPGETCDVARANLCGHAALMSACQEPEAPKTVVTAADTAPTPSPLTTSCTTIVKTCGGSALAPTLDDCRRTLSGMNEMGRASMVACMATHCGDRGLLGCEAFTEPHPG